jgi:hypothetical protein
VQDILRQIKFNNLRIILVNFLQLARGIDRRQHLNGIDRAVYQNPWIATLDQELTDFHIELRPYNIDDLHNLLFEPGDFVDLLLEELVVVDGALGLGRG